MYPMYKLTTFITGLDEIKALAREIVRPLMKSLLLGEGSNVTYLVCTKVDERDFPWQD